MSEEITAVGTVRDVDIIPRVALSVDEVLRRLGELKRFIDGVFEEGVHYGKIPDTDKPMIFKPGVELLLQVHSLGDRLETVKEIEDWDNGFFYYRMKAIIFDKRTGNLVCEGLGSCSSRETKYHVRWLFEKDLPPGVDKSQLKYKEFERRDRSGSFRKYQWRNENPADQQNTILKMAVARALRDAGLRATFSSSLFTEKGTDWIEVGYEVRDAETGEIVSQGSAPRTNPRPQQPEPKNKNASPKRGTWGHIKQSAAAAGLTNIPEPAENATAEEIMDLARSVKAQMADRIQELVILARRRGETSLGPVGDAIIQDYNWGDLWTLPLPEPSEPRQVDQLSGEILSPSSKWPVTGRRT